MKSQKNKSNENKLRIKINAKKFMKELMKENKNVSFERLMEEEKQANRKYYRR